MNDNDEAGAIHVWSADDGQTYRYGTFDDLHAGADAGVELTFDEAASLLVDQPKHHRDLTERGLVAHLRSPSACSITEVVTPRRATVIRLIEARRSIADEPPADAGYEAARRWRRTSAALLNAIEEMFKLIEVESSLATESVP